VKPQQRPCGQHACSLVAAGRAELHEAAAHIHMMPARLPACPVMALTPARLPGSACSLTVFGWEQSEWGEGG